MATEAEVLVVAAAWPEAEVVGDGAASRITAALGALGLVTISMAATLAATLEPAPGGFAVADSYYYHYHHLALAGTFLGGVTLVGASVWVSDNPAARRAAGKKLLYTAVPLLLAAVGLSVAALLW